MAAGKFITLEGGEGAGKSTQAKMLAERLLATGLEVVVTREPGGTAFAERLRAVLLGGVGEARSPDAEVVAFYAARQDHLDLLIRPALSRGAWVVCDRYSDSTRVYQGLAGKVPLSLIDRLEELVVGATQPDLTVVLDLDPAVGLDRARSRRATSGGDSAATDRYEARDLAYHTVLRDGFLEIARSAPERCVIVDGAAQPDAIGSEIWQVVTTRLLAGGSRGA